MQCMVHSPNFQGQLIEKKNKITNFNNSGANCQLRFKKMSNKKKLSSYSEVFWLSLFLVAKTLIYNLA